jgi:hypothetical protein
MMMEVGDSLRFLPQTFEGVSLPSKVNPEVLVLDGQQRLTALYLTLLRNMPVPTTTENKKEIQRIYYLDMEKCLDTSADRFDAVVSVPETRKITLMPLLSPCPSSSSRRHSTPSPPPALISACRRSRSRARMSASSTPCQ